METNCNKMRPLVERYFDGELSRRQASRLEDHLTDCPKCEAQLESMQRRRGALQGVLRQAASSVDFETMWRGIAPALTGPKPSLWERLNVGIREYFSAYKPIWAMAGAAAAVAALVAIPLLTKDGPAALQAPEVAVKAPQSNECIIDSIESSGGSTPMVQELQNQTKVIWMFEEPEDQNDGPSGL